jgi:radical SAM protein with 4Fe4S-binding SPASM domain
MYIETENKAKRRYQGDIEYLDSYYSKSQTYPIFSQVLIETRTDCNNHCSFCPQSFFKRKKEIMKWETFTKIIDSLAEIGFAGRIALLVSNEPLLEKRLVRMIKYARRKSARFFVDITTNGLLLNVEKVDELLSAGIDNININDYRSYREANKEKISSHLIAVIEAFKNNPKISYNARSSKEILPNYAGTIPQSFSPEKFGFCNFPFRKLVFSVHGNMLLCCNDFQEKTNFGNIAQNSILSMWNDKEMNKIRESLLDGKRIELCAKCNDSQSYSIYKTK